MSLQGEIGKNMGLLTLLGGELNVFLHTESYTNDVFIFI